MSKIKHDSELGMWLSCHSKEHIYGLLQESLAKVEGLKEQLLDRDNRMSRVCAFIWKHTKINTNDVIGTEGYPNELSLVIEKIICDKVKELEAKVAELEKENEELKGTMDDLEEDITRLGLVNTALTGVIDRIRGGKR